MRQQGIVKHIGRPKTNPPNDEENGGHQPVARIYQNQQAGAYHANTHKHRQELFLAAHDVGDGAQNGGNDGHNKHRNGEGDAPVLGGCGGAG